MLQTKFVSNLGLSEKLIYNLLYVFLIFLSYSKTCRKQTLKNRELLMVA